MIASLTRRFGDLDIAEEAAAEAFATAVVRWPTDGANPVCQDQSARPPLGAGPTRGRWLGVDRVGNRGE